MDKKSFGRLLAVLRAEMGWTQAQLAEIVDVDDALISNIERGTKKIIEPELLLRLANILQLTTLERREFFLAATNMEPGDISRPPLNVSEPTLPDAQKTLQKAVSLVEQLRLPAFLVDVFGDLIAANRATLDLLNISFNLNEIDPALPGAYSAFRFVYGDSLRFAIPEGYEDYVAAIMRAFREVSLRYRAHPYFQYLMKEFRNPKKYPWFERVWRKVSLIDDDKAATVDPLVLYHPKHGQLLYSATSSVVLTPFGELFVVQYIPANEHTAKVFEEIMKQDGTQTLRFAPWPEKPMSKA